MIKMSKLIIEKDKDSGGYVMYRDGRNNLGEETCGKNKILGKFVEMLAATLDTMKNNSSISIDIKKEDIQ